MKTVQQPAPIFFTEEEKEAMRQTPGAYTFRKVESAEQGNAEDRIREMEKTIENLKSVVTAREKELHTCANELCYQCGQYKQEHLGACADCRWLPIRKGRYE